MKRFLVMLVLPLLLVSCGSGKKECKRYIDNVEAFLVLDKGYYKAYDSKSDTTWELSLDDVHHDKKFDRDIDNRLYEYDKGVELVIFDVR